MTYYDLYVRSSEESKWELAESCVAECDVADVAVEWRSAGYAEENIRVEEVI